MNRVRFFPLCMFVPNHAPLLPGIGNMRRHVDQPNQHAVAQIHTTRKAVQFEGSRRKRDKDESRHMHDKYDHDGRHAPHASTEPDIIGIHQGIPVDPFVRQTPSRTAKFKHDA